MVDTRNVSEYRVLFAGSGYSGYRATIGLYDGGDFVGTVQFHEAGKTIPADSESGGIIRAHMPWNMFASVLDVLRNEKPIHFYRHTNGHAYLGTSSEEPVGEEEE